MTTCESPAPGRVRTAVHRLSTALRTEPSLVLTLGDVERLCALDPDACRSVVAAFEDARLLRKRSDGAFVVTRPV